MALATKCPHCNTIFRVAADQLKLRGGIVRCGACNEVFDGNAALVEPAARPTPLIPEVVIAASAATPASSYIQGAPVDFDLDALDADAVPDTAPTATAGELADDATEGWSTPVDAEPGEASPAETAPVGTEPADASPPDAGPEDAASEEAEPPFDVAPTAPAVWRSATAKAPATEAPLDLPEPPHDGEPETPFAEPEPEPEAEAEPEPQPELKAAFAPDLPADVPADIRNGDAFDAAGRIEPSFDTPQEHIVAVALDDLHHFDDLEPEPTPAELQQAALDELHHLGEPEQEEEERDETAMHAIAAVNTDVPDDGPSVTAEPKEEPADEPTAELVSHFVPDPKDDVAARMRALAGVAVGETLDHAELGFVKRANRSERIGRTARLAMAFGIPLLLVALLLQGATTFRNTLAANYPSLKPVLASTCSLLGCKIELPTQLDALSIEQGELQTVADSTFSFSTVLRNQSRTAQAWPHIELILNDSADKPVLRRVFAPRDYLAAPADADKGFAPRSEQTVKLYFELSQLKASGYHIAIFYP
jgi:predicted Zn finger-like uncharacterized protein